MKKVQITKGKIFAGILAVLAIAGATFGIVDYNQHYKAIPNADSTMRLSSAQQKWFNENYKKDPQLQEVVKKHWNGRQRNLIVEMNHNKLSEQQKKQAKSVNADMVASSSYILMRKNGQPIDAQTLFTKNFVFKQRKIKNPNNNYWVSITRSQNKGVKQIFTGAYLINPKRMSLTYLDNDITAMTTATRDIQSQEEKQAIELLDSKGVKGVYYNVTPVYRANSDLVPIGFAVRGITYKQLPATKLDSKGNPVIKRYEGKGKVKKAVMVRNKAILGDKQFNYYIRNAQEGYKINYQNGKVTLNHAK